MNWNNNIDEAPFKKAILGLFEYKNGREVRIVQRTAKFTVEASSDMDCEDECDYNEENDTYYCKEGWYEQANESDDCGWLWISTKCLKSLAIIEYPERERGE